MKRAFIFPGQGSQNISMGKDFFENYKASKETFDKANEILGYDILSLSLEQLNQTEYTQPALLTVSIAILKAIENKFNVKDICSYMAGHSLGEYSALCGSKSFSFEDALNLVQKRGAEMQKACPIGEGGMAACMNITKDDLEDIVNDVNSEGVCELSSHNSENQYVISGKISSIKKAISIIKDIGGKAVLLKVSAPFHSSLMKPAAKEMKRIINDTKFSMPIIPVVSNVNAKPFKSTDEIKKLLIKQITSPVKWYHTINFLKKNKVKEIVEIGPGNVLTNMIKNDNTFNLININNVNTLQEFLQNIK